MVYKTPHWSIELSDGWVAVERVDHVAVRAPTGDAEFRLSSFNVEETGVPAERWVESAAHFDRLKRRLVVPVLYGDFQGYRSELVARGEWFRGHVLRASAFPLDVTYRCAEPIAHRDDGSLDTMLMTLKYNGAAG